MSGVKLLLSEDRGRYLPLTFAEQFEWAVWDITEADVEPICEGPYSDQYWDQWDYVLKIAKHIDSQGNVWTLYQDGDLFAICNELMSDEERKRLGFDED